MEKSLKRKNNKSNVNSNVEELHSKSKFLSSENSNSNKVNKKINNKKTSVENAVSNNESKKYSGFLMDEFLGTNINLDNFFEIEKKVQKFEKKQKKIIDKYKKKEFSQKLEGDKFSKKVITMRRNLNKQNVLLEKGNLKRVKRCNKYLLSSETDVRDIYYTIDKYNSNGKKTIVYFSDTFLPVVDGVVMVVDNYAKILSDRYNIVVCAPKHKQMAYKNENYLVLYCDSVFLKSQGYDLGFPQLDSVFLKYISLLKIDLIHINSPFNMGNYGLQLAKKRKIPSFTTFHSQYKQNFYNAVKNEVIANWLTKLTIGVFQKSTVALTMNTFARNIMFEYGINRPVDILPNATSMVRKNFDENYEKSILNKYKINKNQFNLIFIGRFVEVKNVYFILRVLNKLNKQKLDFNFIFLGYGPEQNKMMKLVKEYGLDKKVIFTGKVDIEDEKAVIIKNSNLLYFPSLYDTDGIVKIECACYDVPTLCIENSGVAANIQNNQNGFLVDNTEEASVNKLKELIKNVNYVKKIGKNANLEIYLTWNDVCDRLDAMYQKQLKSANFKNAKKNKYQSTKKA